MTLTAMRPDSGRSNGRETSLWSDAHASASISAFSVVLSRKRSVSLFNRGLDGRAHGQFPARRSSRNSEPGSTPVTSSRSRARVQAT